MQLRRILISCALVSGAAVTAGCQSDTTPSTFEQKDSSGVTVAESSAPSWSSESSWTLSHQPALQIGVKGGDPDFEFFNVTAACWLRDGRLAVANAGSHTIRFFDLDGRFLGKVGSAGKGPGEYQRLTSLEGYGTDSLMVFDADLRRISILAMDGGLVRVVQLRQSGPEPLDAAFALSDGDFIVAALSSLSDVGGSPGRYRTSQPVYRYGADGVLLDTIGFFPGSEVSVSDTDRGMMIGWAPLGPVTTVDVQTDRVYVGTGEDLEIRVYSPTGDLIELVRGPQYPSAITEEDIERHVAPFLEGIDDVTAREWAERLLNDMEYPEYWPPYSDLIVDPSGNIWISYYPKLFGTPADAWMVFSGAGRFLGDVNLPRGFKILDITTDLIVGVWKDDEGVEYIRVYEIKKGEASA
jgi:WD40 repeat protein